MKKPAVPAGLTVDQESLLLRVRLHHDPSRRGTIVCRRHLRPNGIVCPADPYVAVSIYFGFVSTTIHPADAPSSVGVACTQMILSARRITYVAVGLNPINP